MKKINNIQNLISVKLIALNGYLTLVFWLVTYFAILPALLNGTIKSDFFESVKIYAAIMQTGMTHLVPGLEPAYPYLMACLSYFILIGSTVITFALAVTAVIEYKKRRLGEQPPLPCTLAEKFFLLSGVALLGFPVVYIYFALYTKI